MECIAIYRTKPGTPFEQVAAMVPAESRHNFELYAKGIFRRSWWFADGQGAIAIMETADLEEAKREAADFPMVREGLLELEVIALQPYLGTGTLFTPPAIDLTQGAGT
ncbi:MAG: muconolactone Delta-isomerase family protein [Sphingorhabdus sp.]